MITIFGIPSAALFGQLLIGLINGSFYALLSLGLAVIFGMLNIINFAHGAQYMLGAVAAFGIARSGKLFVRAVIGMALGFLYFVADNFALAMGNLGAYPPFLAAWAPFLLFFMIGEAVLLRTEE